MQEHELLKNRMQQATHTLRAAAVSTLTTVRAALPRALRTAFPGSTQRHSSTVGRVGSTNLIGLGMKGKYGLEFAFSQHTHPFLHKIPVIKGGFCLFKH